VEVGLQFVINFLYLYVSFSFIFLCHFIGLWFYSNLINTLIILDFLFERHLSHFWWDLYLSGCGLLVAHHSFIMHFCPYMPKFIWYCKMGLCLVCIQCSSQLWQFKRICWHLYVWWVRLNEISVSIYWYKLVLLYLLSRLCGSISFIELAIRFDEEAFLLTGSNQRVAFRESLKAHWHIIQLSYVYVTSHWINLTSAFASYHSVIGIGSRAFME
jgi:hypothetical protein